MNNLSFLAFALALLCVAAVIAAYEVRRYRKGLQKLDPDLIWASRSVSRFNKRLGTIRKVHSHE
jgi:ABC-type Fe3+ transport system permease subunit